MGKPWLLLVAAGVTAGAIGGLLAAVLFSAVVALSTVLARQAWAVATVVVMVGALVGIARVELAADLAVDPLVVDSLRVEGSVASHPQSGPSGPRAVVDIERVQLDGQGEAWTPASGQVLVFFGESASSGIGRGDIVRLRWAATGMEAQDSGFRSFIRSADAAASGWAFQTTVLERGDDHTNLLVRLRNTMTQRLEEGIGGDAGALLAGFVTGDDSGLSDSARDAFERTNTSHITAVSGSNVAVLVSIWALAVRSRRFQRAWWAQVLLVVAIWLYVVLVGMGPGAVRAGVFASIMLPAARLGRKPDPMTALMVASAGMLLVRPAFAENVGFWLSMAASAAMVTVVSRRRVDQNGLWIQGVLALVAAQVATFPVTFWAFGGWSPGSLIANLLIGPLVAMLFPIAFLFAGILLLAPWVGDLVGWIPKLGADAIVSIVVSLAGEFPLVRSSAMSPTAIMLLAAICLALIAGLSEDVRRWVRRVVHAWDLRSSVTVAMVLGAGVGVWAVVAFLSIVR